LQPDSESPSKRPRIDIASYGFDADNFVPNTHDYVCALCKCVVLKMGTKYDQLKDNIICNLCIADLTAMKYSFTETFSGLSKQPVEAQKYLGAANLEPKQRQH